MDVMVWVMLAVGLTVLIIGAELLVRGASRLAAALGLSPLVIGLTVVSFGTSSPELAVSVQSSLSGQPDIALGNVVGSNICNVLFILGIAATIIPLKVAHQLIRIDVPLMIGISVLLLLLAWDGQISRVDGALLFSGIIAYIGFTIYQGHKDNAQDQAEVITNTSARSPLQIVLQLGMVGAGLSLLVLGSDWMVNSAVAIAQALGISELVIGLTIIALGTSLPEVAASVVASLKGERDIAVGNVVGSNLFNILAILGLTSLIAPITVAPNILVFDLPIMIVVALACLPVFFTGMQIARWEGVLFLVYYVAYTVFLFLNATRHVLLPLFNAAMMFALPLTLITLMILAGHALWNNRQRVTS